MFHLLSYPANLNGNVKGNSNLIGSFHSREEAEAKQEELWEQEGPCASCNYYILDDEDEDVETKDILDTVL